MLSTQIQPSIATKPRINAVAQYLMALAAVIACYSLYIQFAVPLIEGPPNEITRGKLPPLVNLPSSGQDKTLFIPLLPKDAWELSPCKTLLTSSGTLMFQDFEQQEDGTIQVFPFTMISGLDDPAANGDKPPIVLRCAEGANLKFDKPMRDVFNGGSKIKAARLTGQVEIYRPASAPEKNDALRVITSNVRIDKQRIYTLDNVLFTFGPNRGSGRNLSIDLAHNSGSDALKDFSSIDGVRRLELVFLDNLRIEPSNQDNAMQMGEPDSNPSAGSPKPASGKLFSNSKSPLEITCDGPFIFDFESMTASFQDRVVAQQMDAFQDSIECDRLLLTFENRSTTPADKQGVVDPSTSDNLENDLKLERFVAQGKPSVVTARSKSAKVSADYLRFDVQTNQIHARGDSEGTRNVTLVSPEYQMVTQQLTYLIPEDGSFGPVQATGPGHLLRVASQDNDEFFATWTKSLVSRDDPNQIGLQQIVLDGEAKIRVAEETRIDADRLEVQVWKIPELVRLANGSNKKKWQYQPSRLLATGNVSIRSDELDGTAQQLTTNWPEPDNRISRLRGNIPFAPPVRRVGYRGSLQRINGASSTMQGHDGRDFQRITPNSHTHSQPTFDPNIRQVGFEAELRPRKKTKFHGQEVEIYLVSKGKKFEVRDLTVIGDVSITETQTLVLPKADNSQPAPLKITGEKLRLIPQGDENYRALISGSPNQPARVFSEDLVLVGENINLDQAANKLWIEGAGAMNHRPTQSPPQSEQPKLTTGLGQSFAPEQLDITWQGGMIFDGAKIYFEKSVLMGTQQKSTKNNRRSLIKTFSHGLSVELKKPVNFQDLSDGQKVEGFEVREMVLVNNVSPDKQVFQLTTHRSGDQDNTNRSVVIENQTLDETGKIVEQQKISAPQATIDAVSGSLAAKGPGTIATHRPAKSNETDASNPFGNLAGADGMDGISFIQINFDGDLSVDSKQREMIVTGNIRTIYASVLDWEMTVDPDNAPGRPAGSVHLTCSRLQLAQWSPRNNDQPTNEMIASGNTHIRNDRFDAKADRVSYNSSTDMLVVEGTPRSDANLWIKQTPNDPAPTHLVAEKIRYRIKDQWSDTQGVKNLNINRR